MKSKISSREPSAQDHLTAILFSNPSIPRSKSGTAFSDSSRLRQFIAPSILRKPLSAMDDTAAIQAALNKAMAERFHYQKYVPVDCGGADDPYKDPEYSADDEIQAAFDEIRYLKHQLISARSHHTFLQHILDDTALSAAGASEVGRVEVQLSDSKAALARVKTARRSADRALRGRTRDLVAANARRDETLGHMRQNVEYARSHEHQVYLLRGDNGEDGEYEVDEEYIAKYIAELNLNACTTLLRRLDTARARMESEVRAWDNRVGEISSKVRAEQDECKEAEAKLQKLSTSTGPRHLAEDRKRVLREMLLGRVLTCLSGVEVSDIREDGLSLGVDAQAIVPGQRAALPTHVLDVVLNDNDGDIDPTDPSYTTTTTRRDNANLNDKGPRVVDAGVEPCDVDIDVRDSSLVWAARDVLSELKKVVAQRTEQQ